ncbi:unnamed protein product [Pleuronectes platessa]|uniref:Uncharacterized protein n=1 Tax=Pleuronectes platessa TaxID=8262 RepID=A0A9N7V4R8_PLEPL|nr:unnamed protein product [Pleuronectes platessa]
MWRRGRSPDQPWRIEFQSAGLFNDPSSDTPPGSRACDPERPCVHIPACRRSQALNSLQAPPLRGPGQGRDPSLGSPGREEPHHRYLGGADRVEEEVWSVPGEGRATPFVREEREHGSTGSTGN